MAIEDGDNKFEENSSKPTPPSENVLRETEDGKADLATGVKNYVADLKSGVLRSGITDQFGKPLLFDKNYPTGHSREFVKPGAKIQAGDLSDPESQKTEAPAKNISLGELNFDKKSGITDQFGKPLMYDSSSPKAKEGPEKGKDGGSQPKDESPAVEAFKLNPEMVVAKSGLPTDQADKSKNPADLKAGDQKAVDAQKTPESPEFQQIKDAKLPMTPEQEVQLRSDMAEINKLPEDQKKKVLESLDKIAKADTNDTTKLDPKQRAELVSSLAHQVAHPESIKQGAKDTCVSANVEKTLAMTHPDQYADMAAQLATKGEYTTPDGKTTVKAQRDENGKLADLSDPSKQRSATSEVMQTAITNIAMPPGETYKSYQPGKEPIPDGVIKVEDSGERVQTADGKEKRFEGLPRDAKEDILGKLAPGDGYQSRKVQTAEDLGQAWKDNGGKAPLNVTVRINAEHTGMGQAKDGNAGTHAVTITHMEFGPDGKPTQIYYENTADSTDHSHPNGKPVPADEFVKSMQNERSHQYKDGSTDKWSEPMTATVRTDGDGNRSSKVDAEKSKELDKAVEDFRDSTHKDAFIDYGTNREKMRDSLKDRPRWEIEEMNKRYKEKYGKSIDEDIVDELDGKERIRYRELLKGNDTKIVPPEAKR